MVNRRILFFAFQFLTVFNIANAQTYYFDNYSVQEGLAQSNVYSIIQSDKGYIWLGTASGASYFDGITFTNYSSEDGLADNGVKIVYQDSNGFIWFGHIGGGISRYNGKKFEKFRFDTSKTNFDITSFAEDNEGRLWVSSVGAGAFMISNPNVDQLNKMKFKKVGGQEGLSDNIFNMYRAKTGMIYFIMDIGIKYQKPGKTDFEYFRPDGLPLYFQITTLLEDKLDNIWFGTYHGGLYKLESSTKKFVFFDAVRDGLANNWISSITEDQNGIIWVGTWGGGISGIDKNGRLETFNASNGLNDEKIRCLTVDRENNLLIGTNENGLFIFKGKQFVSYSEKDGLKNNQVWSILQDNEGKYWFGTNSGITLYDPNIKASKNAFQHYYSENSTLESNQIRALKKDKNGTIWVGTADFGVWEFKPGNKIFRYNTIINAWFPPNIKMVTAMDIDEHNNLWVGTTDGLLYYEIDNSRISRLTQINGLTGNDISSIFCDSKGIIWIGARGKGLSFIRGNEIKPVNIGGNYTPTSIAEDIEGNIWIGTEGQGVIVFDRTKVVRQYGVSDGLLADFITLVIIDKKDNIFIGTNRGLNKFNQKTKSFSAYTKRIGFIGIEVKNNAGFCDSEGNFWFGTVRGALKNNLAYEKFNNLEPITNISRFRVNLKDYDMISGLRLSYREKSIIFDYNAICLTNPEDIKYKVMLVGIETDWRPITKTTTATYSSLPPGKYTFKVLACNNEGIWNTEPVTYSFKINPPFWMTWWFYSIIGISLIVAIIAYIKIRERNLIREKKILEEKVAERTAEVVRQKEEIEREKEKSEKLLLNTLPLKVVNDLKIFGKTEPESFDQVTVYFSDVAGFTNMSSSLEPAFLISELNDIFTAFDDIMVKHQCERIKTIGDAYMAVCGMPEKNEKHAENITLAAMDILRYLEERNNEKELKWRIRIGINSGRVVGGIVGVRKYIYDVFGDTINTASRMESNSEPMRINCSENTYLILKNTFKFIEREPLEVKGKGKMKMYFVDR